MEIPLRQTLPLSAFSSPARILIKVLFPHPLSPNSTTISPSFTEREKFLSTSCEYRLHKFVTSIAFCMVSPISFSYKTYRNHFQQKQKQRYPQAKSRHIFRCAIMQIIIYLYRNSLCSGRHQHKHDSFFTKGQKEN